MICGMRGVAYNARNYRYKRNYKIIREVYTYRAESEFIFMSGIRDILRKEEFYGEF